MNLQDLFQNYIFFLQIEKKLSPLTLSAYNADLQKFITHFRIQNLEDFLNIDYLQIQDYLMSLEIDFTLNNYSIHRNLSSLNSFYKWLEHEELIPKNPF